MEGGQRLRGMVCGGATQTICLLTLIIYLVMCYTSQSQSFGFFNRIKLYFGTRSLSNAMEDAAGTIHVLEDNVVYLQPLFESLIAGYDDLQKLKMSGFACDSTVDSSLVCVASKSVKIDTKTMEISMPITFINNSTNNDTTHFLDKQEKNDVVQVRPYAWSQIDLLKTVTPVKFLHEPPPTLISCDYNHTVPAVVFSSGGFTGNLFHEFNEIIIPLFITSNRFKSRVQFILVDYNPSFVNKFKPIFSSLSDYNLLNPTTNTSVHCFPGAVVGLKFHSFLAINSSEVPKGNSMIEFKKFLRTTFDFKIKNVSETEHTSPPVLLLVSRRKTRLFLNEDEIVDMMEELGFEVVVVRSDKKMSNLERFAKLVSKCSVLVGAHGAGLTNLVFLPAGAVVVQVVPLGLEWPSTVYFGGPAVRMGLRYLDYKIGPEESSLMESYGRDDPVVSDPGSVFAKGYYVGKEMYLDKQNIRVDVSKFKGTLIEALRLLGRTTPISTR